MRVDAAVIGGGVVGLATAMRLARRGLQVALLERHPTFGYEASSRNSEVVHAGMYYPTGSLKATLCVAGNRSLYAWCAEHGVEARRMGKYIVATSDDEIAALEEILTRGRANGVAGLRWAEPGEVRVEEPDVRAVAALFSPDTGIVDSHALMESFRREAERADAFLAFGHEYLGAERDGAGYRVRFRAPDGAESELMASRVVNAAGLAADDVAAAMGLDVDALGYRLRFVKGSYFRLSERWRGRLRHLIYPVPHTGLTGLGSHVTLDLAGGARLGPDVEFLDAREQRYAVSPERAAGFVEAVSRYLPDIRLEDLRPDQAGIRCRRVIPGAGSPDFVIAEESERGLSGWVNLVGIESPGLTCCLEIAGRVEMLLAG